MSPLSTPLLIIAYHDDARGALVKSVAALGIETVVAASFLEAEDAALAGLFCGILVDLPSMVKAKGEEKTVACSLTGFFPTLRVRTIGSMLIPMTMPGEAKQDGSLNDFIAKSCADFVPRRLRASRRKEVILSTLCRCQSGEGQRGFTLNLSWGGAFIADVQPEKFQVGQELSLILHEAELEVPVTVRWLQPWGCQRRPGFGVEFREITPALEEVLLLLLHHGRDACKDRMVAS